MRSKNEIDMILQKVGEAYRTVYGQNLVRVILYGSYARGDYDSESDIDIAAIVRGNRVELQEQLKRVWDLTADLELEIGTVLSPTVIPYEEFTHYQKNLPYYRNIVNEGVDIVAL